MRFPPSLVWLPVLVLTVLWEINVSDKEEPLSEEASVNEAEAAVENDEAVEQELSEVEVLQQQIEALQDEMAQTKDQALRTVADAQNIKRRAEQDIEKARKFALEKFAGELLAVADNMERAVQAADQNNELVKPLVEGVELTQKTLLGVFEKFQITQLDPVGEPFNPEFHQAMSMVENPDAEPNSVIAVMQKGYTLNERLLRPAMVVVSKAAANIDTKA